MQFANTGRGDRPNNAKFNDTGALLQAKRGVEAGEEVLLAYGWTAATWEEIDSGIVGLLAWEERKEGEGPGEERGQYVEELATARRGRGLATHMFRVMRGAAGGHGAGWVELAAHRRNAGARKLYDGLRFAVCSWWEDGTEGWELRGKSVYTPERPTGEDGTTGGVMMRANGAELDSELARRAEAHGGAERGVRYLVVEGLEGLRDANLLKGARAMVNRVYGGEEWWLESDRNRVECLYRQGGEHRRFVLALTDAEDRGATIAPTGDGVAAPPRRAGEGTAPGEAEAAAGNGAGLGGEAAAAGADSAGPAGDGLGRGTTCEHAGGAAPDEDRDAREQGTKRGRADEGGEEERRGRRREDGPGAAGEGGAGAGGGSSSREEDSGESDREARGWAATAAAAASEVVRRVATGLGGLWQRVRGKRAREGTEEEAGGKRPRIGDG